MTSEGAFSYLARDFGLKELYLWPINADQQGTPQQVRKVIDAVRANKIPAVFSESTVSDQTRPSRWRARPAPNMAACSMSTRSARPTARCRPISTCCGSRPRRSRRASRSERNDRRSAVRADPSDAGAGICRQRRHRHLPQRPHRAARCQLRHPGGTITALVGVNGSGKSTLFKAIMGFVPPGAGRDRRSSACRSAQALKQNLVAYVPQSRGGRLELSGPGRGRGDDGPLRPHGHAAHRQGGRPRSGRRGARPRRHERLPQAPDRRAVRRPEEARLPRPRAGAGRPG